MNSKVFALALCAISYGGALAAESSQEMPKGIKTVEEYQAISDRALEMAKKQAAMEKARATAAPVTAPLLNPDSLKRTQGADPGEIAQQYKGFSKAALPQQDDLIIFVSSSVPMGTLVKLARQASAAGAIVVFRGVNGDIRKPGEFTKWVSFLKPMVQAGASIQVNPKLFTQYQITAVPAFVLAHKEESCSVDRCQTVTAAASGDVSLDYVLEKWADRPGAAAPLANSFLARMGAFK